MGVKFSYTLFAKIYDMCEVLFFCRKKTSPRHALLDYISDEHNKILDICTGTATNGILIAEKKLKSNVVGIDISKDMISIANRKIKKKQLNNIQINLMDATNLEYDDGVFDIVIISLVLHETGKAVSRKILNEAKRVLKPGGKILVVEWEQPKSFFKKIKFLIIKLLEPKSFKDFLKLNYYQFFKDNGLEINNIRHCDYSCVFELLASRDIKNKSYNIIIKF